MIEIRLTEDGRRAVVRPDHERPDHYRIDGHHTIERGPWRKEEVESMLPYKITSHL